MASTLFCRIDKSVLLPLRDLDKKKISTLHDNPSYISSNIYFVCYHRFPFLKPKIIYIGKTSRLIEERFFEGHQKMLDFSKKYPIKNLVIHCLTFKLENIDIDSSLSNVNAFTVTNKNIKVCIDDHYLCFFENFCIKIFRPEFNKQDNNSNFSDDKIISEFRIQNNVEKLEFDFAMKGWGCFQYTSPLNKSKVFNVNLQNNEICFSSSIKKIFNT